jgi:hypothetical protein
VPLARGIARRRTPNQPEREFDLKNARKSAFECEMSATPIVSRMLCMESDGIPTSTAPQVKGTDNQVKGTDNQVKGTDNQVKGTDNQVKGTDNLVKGTDNQVKAWRATGPRRPLHRTPRQPLTARLKDSARETNGPCPTSAPGPSY